MSRLYLCRDCEDREHLFLTNDMNHFQSDCAWLTLGGARRTERLFAQGERIINEHYDGKTYSKDGPYIVQLAVALTPEQLQRFRIKAEHIVVPSARHEGSIVLFESAVAEKVTVRELELLLK